MKLRICPKCGKPTIEGNFCTLCGSPLTQRKNNPKDDEKLLSDELLGKVELRPENEIIRVRRRMFWNIQRYVNGVIDVEKFLSKMEELIELDRKNYKKVAETMHEFDRLSSEIHANWVKYQEALKSILNDFKKNPERKLATKIYAEAKGYTISVANLNKEILELRNWFTKMGLDAQKMREYIDVLKKRCVDFERKDMKDISSRLSKVVEYLEGCGRYGEEGEHVEEWRGC